MLPILTDSDQFEKMDLLLGILIKEPEATVPEKEFGRTAKSVDAEEIEVLKTQLIHDGAIVLRPGPRGPEISITDAGIDFFLSGGYSRDWSEWVGITQMAQKKDHAKGRRRLLWLILLLGIIALLFFAFKR
jgi:hypothetical protein